MTNPITDFTGPEFLAFYAIVIGIIVAVSWFWRRSTDATALLPPLPVPEHLDPYEIAYLRDGENEMAWVAVVRLMEDKFLRAASEKTFLLGTKTWIEQDPGHPDAKSLKVLESSVFNMFKSRQTVDKAFIEDIGGRMTAYALPHEQRLVSERLVTSEDEKSAGTTRGYIAAAVIVAIGASRCVVGVIRGRSIDFLVFMGLIGLSIAMSAAKPGRLTERGKTYLKRAQDRWTSLSSEAGEHMSLALLTGIFGMTALAATPLAFLADMFRDWQASLSSDGGGGCGGGGCGGCGGCG